MLVVFSAHGSSCIRLSAPLYCVPVKATPGPPTWILCPLTRTSTIGLFCQWRVWTTVAAAPTSGRGSWLLTPPGTSKALFDHGLNAYYCERLQQTVMFAMVEQVTGSGLAERTPRRKPQTE